MSIYDYQYDSTNSSATESGGIGGTKYAATTKNHNNTSSADPFYCTELSLKHQLCNIALSMASLCNIGNSCYMNSVIYTLRFTPLFLHNLHHLVNDFNQIVNRKETQMKLKSASLGRNVSSLQCQNSRSYSSKDLVSLGSSSSPSSSSSPAYEIIKTTQQTAVEKLHILFKSLTSNEIADSIEPYQSDILLKAIQDVNPIFEGNQQQDAHEFLMCILDSIRESCQSLTKVINDYPEIVVGGWVSTDRSYSVHSTAQLLMIQWNFFSLFTVSPKVMNAQARQSKPQQTIHQRQNGKVGSNDEKRIKIKLSLRNHHRRIPIVLNPIVVLMWWRPVIKMPVEDHSLKHF